jgi:hypothetical protein
VFKTKVIIAAAALIFTAIALTITTSGLLTAQKAVPASGAITHSVGIGVYTDQAAITPCTNIDLGSLTAYSSNTQVIYVKNTGNTTETLHLTTTDWNPTAASTILSLTWDKEDTPLSAGSVTTATLTLSMGQDTGVVDSFDFNIIIEGLGN